MGRFQVSKHGGLCTAKDITNGVCIDWICGDFNGTRDVEADPDRGPQTPDELARIVREIWETLVLSYAELL